MEKSKSRKLFTAEEDEKLRHIMETVEFEKWSQVAALLGGNKNPRQCRDRWVNYLSPGVKKLEWTEEEDLILVQSYQNLGKKWSKITHFLPGRSENHIKNRWHSYLKKHFENEQNLTVQQIRQIIKENHSKSSFEGSKGKHHHSSTQKTYKKQSPPVVDPIPNMQLQNFPAFPQSIQHDMASNYLPNIQQQIPTQMSQQNMQIPYPDFHLESNNQMNQPIPITQPTKQQIIPNTQPQEEKPKIPINQPKAVKPTLFSTFASKPTTPSPGTRLLDRIFSIDERNPINLFPDQNTNDIFSLL